MFSSDAIPVFNAKTDVLGLAVAIEASPYPAEEAAGIERLKVWAEVPGSGGIFYGWDWWLMGDVAVVTPAEEIAFAS
jgi:hypothetical protein